MRYFWAIASLAVGALLMLAGLGQRTIFADPADTTVNTPANAEVSYAVVTDAELAKVPGTPTITVPGEHAFLAYAKTDDIEAWLAPVGYAKLQYRADAKEFRITETAPTAPAEGDAGATGEDATGGAADTQNAAADDAAADDAAADGAAWQDPAGSDLWVDEVHATGGSGVSETVKLKPGQAVLVASTTQGTPLDHGITVHWHRAVHTPWAGPLLVAGGALALLGLILYIIAIDRDRRGLGPRRGRRGPLLGLRDSVKRRKRVDPIHPGRNHTTMQARMHARGRARRRLSLLSVTAAGALVLTGCSPSYWPSFDLTADSDQKPKPQAMSPVTDKQLERIVNDISETAVTADKKLDAEALKTRFASDALRQREANYKIRSAEDSYAVVPPFVLNERLGYELIQSTDTWPRSIFIALASSAKAPSDDAVSQNAEEGANQEATDADEPAETDSASPSLGLLIRQDSPQQNYRVERIFSLRGGISMPSAAPADEGTAVLANDISTLKVSPEKLGDAYATVLVKGTDDPAAADFDVSDDPVFASGGGNWVSGEQSRLADQEGEASYSVTAKATDSAPIALSTGAGGALVMTTIVENRATEAKEGSELPVGNVVKAISGMSGKKAKIVQSVEHQLLFFVPNKTSKDPVQLLGSTSELVGATD